MSGARDPSVPKRGTSEVIPGTLYCWDQPTDQDRAAEYVERDGQLVWQTLDNVRPSRVLAFALLDAEAQVRVVRVNGPDGKRFVRVVIDPGRGEVDARVSFEELIDAANDPNGAREWVRVERD